MKENYTYAKYTYLNYNQNKTSKKKLVDIFEKFEVIRNTMTELSEFTIRIFGCLTFCMTSHIAS